MLKPAVDHLVHQLVVLGQAERGLGEEAEGIVPLLLPARHLRQERLDLPHVADEVVVDDEERASPPLLVEERQLVQELVGRLRAGPAPEQLDDVAELARVGAARGSTAAAIVEYLFRCTRSNRGGRREGDVGPGRVPVDAARPAPSRSRRGKAGA